ncbi:hypothetical protein ACXZ66_04400 [Corynebacterium sp. S7]
MESVVTLLDNMTGDYVRTIKKNNTAEAEAIFIAASRELTSLGIRSDLAVVFTPDSNHWESQRISTAKGRPPALPNKESSSQYEAEVYEWLQHIDDEARAETRDVILQAIASRLLPRVDLPAAPQVKMNQAKPSWFRSFPGIRSDIYSTTSEEFTGSLFIYLDNAGGYGNYRLAFSNALSSGKYSEFVPGIIREPLPIDEINTILRRLKFDETGKLRLASFV